jgi:hypothetical protein
MKDYSSLALKSSFIASIEEVLLQARADLSVCEDACLFLS